MKTQYLLLFLFFFSTLHVHGQSVQEELSLSVKKWQQVLRDAPRSSTQQKERNTGKRISLPLPGGKEETFEAWEVSLMAPSFAASFPEIKTYAVQNEQGYGRLTVSPSGFYATLFTRQGWISIHPAQAGNPKRHVIYKGIPQQDLDLLDEVICNSDGEVDFEAENTFIGGMRGSFSNGNTVRTYNLAIVCTGEFYLANGGNATAVNTVITNTINSVEAIYENELAIHFNLLTPFLYTDPNTDEFDPASSLSRTEHAARVVDLNFTQSSYDIGHVLHDQDYNGSLIRGTLSTSNPNWRGAVLNSSGNCTTLEATNVLDYRYVGSFSVTQAGTYTFQTTNNTTFNEVIVIYENGFNTASPCSFFLDANRELDGGGNLLSSRRVISQSLSTSSTYYLFVSSATAGSVGTYEIEYTGPGIVRGTLQFSGGGVAGLSVVCRDIALGTGGYWKARGWSGGFSNSGTGWIQLTAHEFGHQFSALHTFNGTGNSCTNNISNTTAYEIGSGTTIMAYNGLCSSSQNLPDGGDADSYFHTNSIDRMLSHVATYTCASTSTPGNTAPTSDANPCNASNVTIPKGTPFELRGAGSDSDGDALTYCWEQYDEDGSGTPTQGLIGSAAANSTLAPLNRSYPPQTTPFRTFPDLSTIASGTPSDFDVLSNVARTLNYRLTVRDNHSGSGGVACDAMMLNIDSNGPFEITTPSGSVTWTAGNSYSVQWSDGGFSGCTDVDILLSIDGGQTFPYTLATGENFAAGSATVSLPAGVPNTSLARVRVECADYECVQFFNLSPNDFNITSDCATKVSYITPDDAISYPFGDPNLDLAVSKYYGENFTEETVTVDNSYPQMESVTGDDTNTSCLFHGFDVRYYLLEFQVDVAGTYTFSYGSFPLLVSNLYQGSFNPNDPCPTWIASNTTDTDGNPGGQVSGGLTVSASLQVGTTYYYSLAQYFSSADFTRTITVSGPGNVRKILTPPGADYAYTWTAISTADNQIKAFDTEADFTSLSSGNYNVYGVVYKATGSPPPPLVDTTSWINQTINQVYSAGDCALFSANFKPMEITGSCTPTTFYADTDMDTFGDPNSTTMTCSAPSGYVADNTDCDDTNASINPNATEVCDGLDNDCDGNIDEGVLNTYYLDADMDSFGDPSSTTMTCSAPSGYVADNTDCDDSNASINPNANEVCDGVDNDCDGNIDEGVLNTYYLDADMDSFGDPSSTTMTCSAPSGYVADNTDCDDSNASINPNATEVCDGLDNDCDGNIDEGVLNTYYLDADMDSFGDPSSTTMTCSAPSGYVADNTDCDDSNASINPNATEVCDGLDNDCDGNIDEGVLNTYYLDADMDSFGDPSSTTMTCSAPSGYVTDNTDCDDSNASINPNANEVCDGVDNDCDGNIDEGVLNTYYLDADMDSFGDPSSTTMTCSAPSGYVADNTDCDDSNASINPNATEVCDGLDNDCDGNIDEGVLNTYYLDADMDSFGDPSSTTMTCSAPSGYVADNTDCDDSNASINPNANEVCDGVDNDCDGNIDEGVLNTYYLDADMDSFGDPSSTTMTCSAPSGYVADNTDCDDTNASINPNATEVCDGLDNDCDGNIDEGVLNTYYLDADMDSFGDPSSTTMTCSAPSGYVADNTDCDDSNASINPNANEVCDGVDNDCDGNIDEGVLNTYYLDADMDSFGDPSSTTMTCSAPSGYVADNTDCDDSNASINPNANEVCDGLDNDCDGNIDEGVLNTYYLDADMDSFGDPNSTTMTCSAPSGYVADNTDCDDTNASINPNATEICDGVDNDCDGNIDEGVLNTYYLDGDDDGFGIPWSITMACSLPDGYAVTNTDCNDNDKTINPNASEVCDGIDNNCDGNIDEGVLNTYYLDADMDSFGDPSSTTMTCSAPSGYVADNTDCDDSNASINPNATEVCDGLDNDCDGNIDEGVLNTYYLDADMDSFGDPSSTTMTCSAPSGYVADNTDCDDSNASINPNANEVCDGLDNDCDGNIDEGVLNTYYLDADMDSFGDPSSTTMTCSAPSGYVADNTDCDDSNASINPNANEVCDGLDNDCDGNIDEGVLNTYYLDADMDSFGDPSSTTMTCSAPSGYVADNTDCDDSNASINPNATEVCDGLDNDCDGNIDEGVLNTYYLDADMDSFGDPSSTTMTCSAPSGYVADNTDCDDSNASINPNATEVCDGLDNDCDGNIDEGVLNTYYLDADMDSFGDPSSTTMTCSAPSGYVADNTDCDDTNASINPNANEVCDGLDNDCDGNIDEGVLNTYYLDADMDSFGDPSSTTMTCSAPSGYVADNTDCDDTNASINPNANEVCDGLDNDCDGNIDEGVLNTYYLDADMDSFGDPSSTTMTCSAPSGYVADNTDCDDSNASINPNATEVCDGLDNDCDGNIDEGVLNTYYLDADMDSFGDPSSTTMTCSAPSGYVADNTDCDDTNASINPNATEVCDGLDNDCDGNIDEGVLNTYYLDADMDSFGDPSSTTMTCSAPSGYVADNTDCDDSNASINPNATEVCDGVDNDCDGNIDEGVLNTYYLDADMDSFGDPSSTTMTCSAPSGYVADNTDCDDTNASINPNANEVCDGLDNDCDGNIDEGVLNTYYLDADMDSFGDPSSTTMTCSAPSGYVADNTDCDDSNASINPNATEVCDGVDNDCDGNIDEGVLNTYYLDADMDSFGDPSSTTSTCAATPPSGFVDNNTDCDDSNASVNPGMDDDDCDGVDNNCDGYVDEHCPGNLRCDDVDLVIQSITRSFYHAEQTITSDAVLNTGDDIEFTAGNEITLESDFEVPLGGILEARIEDCTLAAPPVEGINEALLRTIFEDSDWKVYASKNQKKILILAKKHLKGKLIIEDLKGRLIEQKTLEKKAIVIEPATSLAQIKLILQDRKWLIPIRR